MSMTQLVDEPGPASPQLIGPLVAGRLFARVRVRRAIDAVMGGLLIGLGLRIAVQSN